MTEVIVPHTYHAQQRGWSCGASTAKVVLSTYGQQVTEEQMITECGTTVDGTADVANINAVLTRRTGRQYAAHYIGNATADRVQALRLAIKETVVDSRRGMPVNIWAQAPTQPPGYPASLIMHYVTAVGYDDATDRAYISDSARFSGIEHWWMSVDRLALNITPKGYGALVAPDVPDPFGHLSPAQQQTVWSGFAQLAGPS
ncbi:C39 family peptidase [uncultured Gordonia sp.]|uniref:C39 family peptidase n=1 Tax=uncultured Gordonia sp. TaxID=198437 RepID=UPI0025860306|nr:C39 family peptidase [uncultured Gordonia sp.]